MQKIFWLVWCEECGHPTYKHQHEDEAREEAERLARNNPGRIFHVLKLVDSCRKKDVFWGSDFTSLEEIPF